MTWTFLIAIIGLIISLVNLIYLMLYKDKVRMKVDVKYSNIVEEDSYNILTVVVTNLSFFPVYIDSVFIRMDKSYEDLQIIEDFFTKVPIPDKIESRDAFVVRLPEEVSSGIHEMGGKRRAEVNTMCQKKFEKVIK